MDFDENDGGIPPTQEIDFCTLGMLIIDEIHYLPPEPPVYNILGGAGSYSALGARLFSPAPLSKNISWIVDEGSDFPSSIRDQIAAWNTSCLIRTDSSRLTTRGWNGYDLNQNRAFKYTTPRLRLDETSLSDALLFSRSFHMCCSPSRCTSLTSSILRRRKRINPNAPKPIFIWEPVPELCTPDELLNTTNALPYVDVCSPNHHELATLMGDPRFGLDPTTGEISSQAVERACEQLLSSMPLQSYTLVIRCGAKGCYVAKNGGRSRRPSVVKRKRPANHARGGLTPEVDMMALFAGLMVDGDGSIERDIVPVDPGVELWVPAYFQTSDTDSRQSPHIGLETKEDEGVGGSPMETTPIATPESELSSMSLDPKPKEWEHKVIDPTGGGNTFLGAFSVALSRGKGLLEAAAWGTVAASFAIEQVGVPELSVDNEGRETWNGVDVGDRLEEFERRVRGGLR